MNDFVKEQSVTVYDSASIAGATAETKEKLSKSLINFELLGIDKNMKIAIENKHRKYLNFHRNKIFKDY